MLRTFKLAHQLYLRCLLFSTGTIAGIVTSNSLPIAVRASDLVGCRYKLRQRAVHPEVPPLPEALARQPQVDAARQIVFTQLPVKRAVGDGRRKAFVRMDLDPAAATVEDTRAAIRRGAHLITNAPLVGDAAGAAAEVRVDVLVRASDGYVPVMISNHRVARPDPDAELEMVATNRIGLSTPLTVRAKARHHTEDGYRLALAELLLRQIDAATGRGGLIGQDRTRAYLGDVTRYIQPLLDALALPVPAEPKRLKKCATCRFWELCRPRLEQMDDISLVFPGGTGDAWRERGYPTVQSLIDADLGEPSALARAWREGVPVLRRPGAAALASAVPRADVEIDVDMEAYLDQGAYLWGAYDGERYQAFVTWAEVGGAAEEANFTAFWTWLMETRAQAHTEGKTFRAYCFAAGGENYWLKTSAKRFGTVPVAEVQAFIASDEWVDVFALAKRQLVGTDGLGLKVLGPAVGFTWRDEEIDGDGSIALRRLAREGDRTARAALLRYNEDDCRATRAVRDFLAAGSPGIPELDA
ncbi:TM0106 family RecB-like putative nuclease [Corynebacterium aquatimens]|uniref:TM0106 family RecB-like putative nuclease n=1 Tax=Corynebacterium aquatimens TaxID=1190508 RepID=UPI002540FBC7|nr:TM0106 family RecB-like putative nuclease [Corynebacterium aquatimens]QYH19083.1 TM0106 family RecB-like putative nuclease [Corynebacterium aquatimens]